MEVFKLDSSMLDADGRHIACTFETDSQPLTLEFNITALEEIMSRLAPILAKARELRGGVTTSSWVQPDALAAKPMLDHHGVLLALRMPSGLDHNFALPVPMAEDLLARVGKAVQKCKGSSS